MAMARPTISLSTIPSMSTPTRVRVSQMRMLHTSLPHRAPAARASPASASAPAGVNSSSLTSTSTSTSSASASASVLSMLERITKPDEVDDARRSFRAGNFTPPHSLTSSSLYPDQKPFARAPLLGPPRKIATKIDPFHLSKTSPTTHDMNPLFALSFVNQMGKIKGRAETGLTWKSQRKVGKLVRRARAMGLVSAWSNQPVPGGLAAGGMGRFNRF